MTNLIVSAELFDNNNISLGKHKNIEIDIKNLLIKGLKECDISIDDFSHHYEPGLPHVKVNIVDGYLKLYMQMINNKKTMSHEIYKLLEDAFK